ncbi:MAG: acyloxyacyl hydrolase [Rhodospirillales bacterium]
MGAADWTAVATNAGRGMRRVFLILAPVLLGAGDAAAGTGIYDFSIYPEFAGSQTSTVSAPTGQTVQAGARPQQQPAVIAPALAENHDPLISEIRFGVLAHNVGPLASRTEDGIDINPEILFRSPDFLEAIWSPRPMIGATISIGDDTSILYSGLMWRLDLFTDVFADLSFGMAVHNGNAGEEPDSEGRRALGCRWLFRESVELGYKINETYAVAAYLDHVSHGGLCSDRNRGMDNTGVRVHYAF